MSSLIRRLVEGHRSIARNIDDFMWEGRPMKGDKKKEHTQEEFELLLIDIRKECWALYDETAEELEWR